MNPIVFSLTVFLAGILSFFSPCVFPLLPVYIGVLLGSDQEKSIQKADSGIVMTAPHEQVDKAALAQMIIIMRAAFFDRSLIF